MSRVRYLLYVAHAYLACVLRVLIHIPRVYDGCMFITVAAQFPQNCCTLIQFSQDCCALVDVVAHWLLLLLVTAPRVTRVFLYVSFHWLSLLIVAAWSSWLPEIIVCFNSLAVAADRSCLSIMASKDHTSYCVGANNIISTRVHVHACTMWSQKQVRRRNQQYNQHSCSRTCTPV